MCKYCKLTQERGNEKTNDVISIGKIKDGSQLLDLSLNRYISDKSRSNELILDLSCVIGDAVYNVKIKEIKIKYYPFCGEEL